MVVVPISNNPFRDISKIDALAQCPNPKCKRIWSYDGVDALLDYATSDEQSIEVSNIYCRGCGTKAKLYQETRLNS